MSSITGIYNQSGSAADPELLLTMAGELQAQESDSTSVYLDERFAMAAVRSNSAAHLRPQRRAAQRIQAQIAGRVHNLDAVRERLAALGHRFQSADETEIVACAFREWGSACLDRLNGEFALAIWDQESRELFLARDRFGSQPLFFAWHGRTFCFASLTRALLRHPAASRELDPVAISDTLQLWSARPDRSSFSGISELPPAHWLKVRSDGSSEQHRWWELRFTGAAPWNADGTWSGTGGLPDRHTRQQLADELRQLLTEAVRLRSTPAEGIGVYISGGLDSSLLAALLQAQGGARVAGFAISFADQAFDETPQQDKLAAALDIPLQRITVTDADIAAAFPRMIELAERPLLRTAPAPLLLLAELAAAQGRQAILTGEGADELFGGYNIFKEAQVRRFWARNPESRLRPQLLRRLYPYLGSGLQRSGALLGSYFGSGLLDTLDPLYSHHNRFRNGQRNLRFLKHASSDTLDNLRQSLPAGFSQLGPLSQAQHLEIHTFLQGNLLHSQGERMLRGAGLSGRLPFLDVHVAQFAADLPEKLRLNGLHEKYLLRLAAAPLLPTSIAQLQKRPYRAPLLRPFLAPDAPEWVQELLSPDNIARTDLFNSELVTRLAAKCRRQLPSGNTENDEMALTFVLSTLLLQQQLSDEPRLARRASPTSITERQGGRTSLTGLAR